MHLGTLSPLELYSRSTRNIWTDPHVARQMLPAHLDPSNDAATRNAKAIAATIDWIDSVAEGGSRLIDLGCGPGLYAEAFHDRNYQVTGIDISENSINHAKAHASATNRQIRYEVGNYIEQRLAGDFDLAVCIYCDFGALIPHEQEVFLANVRSALRQDGLLIFDVFGPGVCAQKQESRTWTLHPDGGFWSPVPHLELSETLHFEQAMAWGHRTVIIEDGKPDPKTFVTWDSYYTEAKLGPILAANGFKLEQIRTGLIESNAFASDDVFFVKARKT